MSPGQAVRDVLRAAAPVTELVGARIYPQRLPPNVVFPAVVYTVVSQVPQETFESTPATSLDDSRVQVDCYARQYDDAQELAEVVADALTARRDLMTVTLADRRDLFEDETMLHRVSSDFSVWRGR